MNADRPSLMRTLAWAAASGSAALLAFLPAATAATWLSDQLAGGNPLRLAMMAALWTSLGVAGIVAIGLWLRTIYRPIGRLPVLLTTLGALAAAAAQAAIWASAELRYGLYPEVDYIGRAVLLAPVLTVLTGALVAFTIARGPARILAAGVGWLAVAAVGFLLLDSLPGVADGISAAGWLAAPAFAVALAVAVFAAALLLRRPIDAGHAG